jgi:hypothetical protein
VIFYDILLVEMLSTARTDGNATNAVALRIMVGIFDACEKPLLSTSYKRQKP